MLKRNKLNFQAGFSLVELLIVIAITTIMTSVLLLTSSSGDAKKDVDAAAQQISAQLRLLQNESLSGKRFETSPGFWQITCNFRFQNEATNSYKVKYYNCAGPPTPARIIKEMPEIKLKRVTISSVDTIFTAPHGKAASVDIVITSTKSAAVTKIVRLTSNGNIEIL